MKKSINYRCNNSSKDRFQEENIHINNIYHISLCTCIHVFALVGSNEGLRRTLTLKDFDFKGQGLGEGPGPNAASKHLRDEGVDSGV